jgi:threonylcarbamoyladenosine tRNA methylthiotransferase MtaB
MQRKNGMRENMKVYFKTFGCRLNRAEALDQEAEYASSGWEIAEKPDFADLIIVRGCSVTRRAEHDTVKTIEKLKKDFPLAQIAIEGCLPLKKKAALNSLRRQFSPPTPSAPTVPTRTSRAYLKVQDGCNGTCTYCTIPKFRGKSVSLNYEDVIGKAKRFIESGYHEIVVTGCNLSLYANGGRRLPELVSALASLCEDCRIRIGSLEPGICDSEIIGAIAENSNICRFLHIPVQSGSDRILLAMRRTYLSDDITRLVSNAVHLVGDIALGCDLIAGFPDETELDHLASKSLLKRLPFTNAHVFPYSERPGTLAATFLGTVPKSIRSQRARSLAQLAAANRLKFAKRFIGRTVDVIIEDEEKSAGWTSHYLWFEALNRPSQPPARKSLAKFKVTAADGDTLRGTIA